MIKNEIMPKAICSDTHTYNQMPIELTKGIACTLYTWHLKCFFRSNISCSHIYWVHMVSHWLSRLRASDDDIISHLNKLKKIEIYFGTMKLLGWALGVTSCAHSIYIWLTIWMYCILHWTVCIIFNSCIAYEKILFNWFGVAPFFLFLNRITNIHE